MHAEDMNIYWNQNKGQYETSSSYNCYSVGNTYTRTADERLYKESTGYGEENSFDQYNQENNVKLESWIGTFFLLLIPIVNFIIIIKTAISCKYTSKKTFARAILLFSLILLTLCLVFMAVTCNKIDYKSLFDTIANYGKILLNKLKGML